MKFESALRIVTAFAALTATPIASAQSVNEKSGSVDPQPNIEEMVRNAKEKYKLPPATARLVKPSRINRDAPLASTSDLLRKQMSRCWRAPVDQPDPARLVVTVQVNLDFDGNLIGEPIVLSPNPIPADDRPMIIAVESAKRAVTGCVPFDLPKKAHEKPITLTFDPREMAQ